MAGASFSPHCLFRVLFVGVSGVIRVTVANELPESGRSVSVLQLGDDETGRRWLMKAEEAGPFPGGLAGNITDFPGIPDMLGQSFGAVEWGGYRSNPVPFVGESGAAREEIAQKGLRVLPERFSESQAAPTADSSMSGIKRVPVLIPFDSESEKAIPDTLPPFEFALEEGVNTANWRFAVSCRADGSVDQCVSLSGESGDSLAAMTRWLRTVRFGSGEGERWLALRVEFENQKTDGR